MRGRVVIVRFPCSCLTRTKVGTRWRTSSTGSDGQTVTKTTAAEGPGRKSRKQKLEQEIKVGRHRYPAHPAVTCLAECQEVGEKCRKESTAAWEHLEISKWTLKLQIKGAPRFTLRLICRQAQMQRVKIIIKKVLCVI